MDIPIDGTPTVPETKSKASGEKTENTDTKPPRVQKDLKPIYSGVFQLLVFAIASFVILGIRAHFNPANQNLDFKELLASHLYWIFAAGCAASILYSLATEKSNLSMANFVLWAIMLAVAPFVAFHRHGDILNHAGNRCAPIVCAAPAYTPRPIDYDDSDTNHLGVGVHHFTFTDSGEVMGPFRDKKEVKGSQFLINGDPQKRLLIIYDDGDTLRCWDPTPPHKSTWGKYFKMVALAPMEVEKDNY